LITVVLSQKGLKDREVILAGVPRQGETIRLVNGSGVPLLVEYVLWQEGDERNPEPQVIIGVRPHVEAPG
jgi:hypothetical protein